MESQDQRRMLADYLRALREETWPGRRISQLELARALGVSTPLVSSWESQNNPKVPSLGRIDTYAVLFATTRSFDAKALGPLSPSDLTDEEQGVMAGLKLELRRLRNAALGARPAGPSSTAEPPAGPDFWSFPDGAPVTIVCAQLPQQMLDRLPYTRVDEPDYIELLTYSDLDSLVEVYGQIRAANPHADVNRRIANKLGAESYQSHLVVLGGVDWNVATVATLDRLALPIRQIAHWSTEGEQYFEVDHDGTAARHRPVLERSGDDTVLREDVALLARAVNPFNRRRTVTICHGMYGRGTYGAVRALTDSAFRASNADYLRSRFGDCEAYCILSRVQVIDGETLTPDWTSGEHILFEWSR